MNEIIYCTVCFALAICYGFMKAELNGERGSDYAADFLGHFVVMVIVIAVITVGAVSWLGK